MKWPIGEIHSSAKSGSAAGRVAGRSRRAKARKRRFTTEELEEFQQALLNKRRELIGDVTHLGNSTRGQARKSDGDDSSSGWELEFAFVAIENKQSLLRDIDDALQRIQDRTYGFCLATNKAISMARLQIMPWAKYCLEHARWRESGSV